MLTFYYARNTCALATHIALEDAGATFEARRIDFASDEQRSPDYLKINPKGRVPALVTPEGVLTETPALLAYIAQTHPDSGLAPLGDAFAFARLQAFAAYLCSTVHVAHAHRPRGSRWADEPASLEDMKRKAAVNFRDSLRLIEREMFAGPFVMGESYSFADPYLFTLEGWLPMHEIDIAEFPTLAAHRRLISERDAVQRAVAAEAA